MLVIKDKNLQVSSADQDKLTIYCCQELKANIKVN